MAAVKRIIITMLITIGAISILSSSSFAAQTGKAKEALKLRKEAKEKTTILEIIPAGEEFEILEDNDESYYKVKYNKIKGYVKAEYVEIKETNDNEKTDNEDENQSTTQVETNTNKEDENQETSSTEQSNVDTNQNTETPSEEENAIKENGTATVKNNTKLYMRPLIYSKTVGEVVSQDVLVLEIRNKWAYVSVNGKNAWILFDNLEVKTDDSSKNTTKTKTTTSRSASERSTKQTNKTVEVASLSEENKTEKTTTQEATNLENNQSVEDKISTTVEDKGSTIDSNKVEISENKTDKVENANEVINKENSEEKKEDINSTTISLTKGEEIVNYAKKYLGYSYVYGGSTPKGGFDCSGFTMYVYKQFGVSLPHSATSQSKLGTKVEKENLQLGDIVYFSDYKTYKGIGHCGIYIGNGQFIHASTEKTGVIISSLNSGSYVKRYVTANRFI